MSNVFIACSSFDEIAQKYKEEAKYVANICINKKYDLVFGTCNKGLMGVVYQEYLKHPERKITAICMKKYEDDIKGLSKVDEVVIFNTTIEQMDYFMKTDKLIYLPGGYGTLTELFYLINAKVSKIHEKEIIIVNTSHFYDKILEHFDILFKEKFINNKSIYKVINNENELNNIL